MTRWYHHVGAALFLAAAAALWLLFFVEMALATDLSRTPPYRPSSADLSLAVFDQYDGQSLKWCRGVTCTQVQRDAIEVALTGLVLPRIIRFARQLPSCTGSLGFLIGNLSKMTSKLDPLYEAQEMRNRGWFVSPSGRDYYDDWYDERRAQQCAVATTLARRQCAMLLSPVLGDYLDLRIENGLCTKGSGLVVWPPAEPYDAARAALGAIVTVTPPTQPALTDEQQALRLATHAAHASGNRVQAAHLAFEASATTETMHHFFRIKDFSGDVDPGWAPADAARWHALQHRFHIAWGEALARGDWFATRQADTDHQLAHICASLKDDRLLVLFSCPAGLGPNGSMDRCEISTCRAALDRLEP